jgi:uncharacterized protein (DUF4415 family)
MPKKKKPRGIHREDWESVDSPALTAEQLAALRPLAETLPALAEASARRKRGQRGPQKKPRKVAVTLRVAESAIVAYRAGGRGYQTRMAAILEKHAR